jgi:hypothetical protein
MALAVLAFHVVFLRRRGLRLPGAGRMFFLTTGAVLLSAALVLVSGPRRVFYALHEQVFPPDNQWFFFYQDSLMSTMMKAPFLFGYIAVALVVLALIYLWILFLLASAVTARQSPPPP